MQRKIIHKFKFSQIGYEDLCLKHEDQPGHPGPTYIGSLVVFDQYHHRSQNVAYISFNQPETKSKRDHYSLNSIQYGSRQIGPRTVGPWTVGPWTVGPWKVGPWTVGPWTVGPWTVGP